MVDDIRPVDPSDAGALDAIVQLIAGQQRRRGRHVVYVGEQPDGIRAELDALHPAWTDTVRVIEEGGAPLGVALSEWDGELGRAWVFGPWIDGDDDIWDRWARPLVESQLAQLPETITSHELSGTVENDRLRRLAHDLGWPPSEVNYAYVFSAAEAEPASDDDGLRGVVADDLGLIAPLHELEFPSTYFSAQQLIERATRGEHTILVATANDGRFAGYAAGRIQPDGIGYIDFVAVEPSARGAGAGRRLVGGLVRRLLPASSKGEVHLTVQEHREAARALYVALGFCEDVGFVGYRSP